MTTQSNDGRSIGKVDGIEVASIVGLCETPSGSVGGREDEAEGGAGPSHVVDDLLWRQLVNRLSFSCSRMPSL